MRTAPATVLLELDAIWVVLLALVRMVVATLALLASERDELTHVVILSEKKHVRIPSARHEGQRDTEAAPGVRATCHGGHGGAV
jgi:hypothetical protein